MRREFGKAFSILVGLIAALMMFSNFQVILCVLCGENPIDHRGHTEKQKPLHLKTQKGWNGHVWLFLPSTVLTVSGSRGLPKNFELRNANFGFNNSTLQFAIHHPNFAILPGLSAAVRLPRNFI